MDWGDLNVAFELRVDFGRESEKGELERRNTTFILIDEDEYKSSQ